MDQRIERLIELLKTALSIDQQVQELQSQFQQDVEKAKTVEEFRKLTKTFADRLNKLLETPRGTLVESLKLAEELGKEKPTPGPPPGAIRPNDIATQFRTLIENIQREARTVREGETAATIKSLDIELKGLIVVEQDEARIVPPHPDKPIEAGQLSTIRMSFGSIPVLKTLEEKPSEEPK